MTSEPNKSRLNVDVEPQRLEHRTRRRSRRGWRKLLKRLRGFRWRLIIVSILVIVVFGVGSLVILITDSINRLETSRDNLNRTMSTLNNRTADQWTYSDFERMQTSVGEVINNIQLVQNRTALVRPFTSVVNEESTQLLETIEVAYDIGLAVDTMLTGSQPAVFFITEGSDDNTVGQVSSGERVVELLQLGRGQFNIAQQHLDEARHKLDGIDRTGLSEDVLLTLEELERYHADIQDVNNLLLQSPDLLTATMGLTEPQTYLILAQNSDELRPSGGYISTYGWMTVRNSRILDYDYRATTTNSPSPPNDEFLNELDIPEWWFEYEEPIYMAWDGSWSPDFTETARLAAWYYDNGRNPRAPVDGVIAIDIVGLEYMLGALGEVEVPGYRNAVTTENFRSVVYEIRAQGEAELAHKTFLADLYQEVLDRWQNVQPEKKSDVLGAILRGLREKHIMIYLSDPELAKSMQILDWDGRLDPAIGHDYLLIADANLSANKSNRSILRQTTYDVEILEDGSLNSTLNINYDYPDSMAANDPAVRPEHYGNINYYNRLQVYVPNDSTLLSSDNLDDGVIEVDRDTHTQFVSAIVVEYNTSERVQFQYSSPPAVETFGDYQRYRLQLQKQPGTLSEVVNVQVKLPAGVNVVDMSPEPIARFELEQPIIEFRVTLVRDTWIEIIYHD